MKGGQEEGQAGEEGVGQPGEGFLGRASTRCMSIYLLLSFGIYS